MRSSARGPLDPGRRSKFRGAVGSTGATWIIQLAKDAEARYPKRKRPWQGEIAGQFGGL